MTPATLDDFLRAVICNPLCHARWLNTLSFLEYIGARKIIKSQNAAQLSDFMMRHLAEEARHASTLRGLSLKIAPNYCQTYEPQYLLAGNAAEFYFQRLDQRVHTLVQAKYQYSHAYFSYLLVTLLIEKRAGDFYPRYQQVLETHHVPISLRLLIEEEAHHLRAMQEALKHCDGAYEATVEELLPIEAALFAQFMDEVAASL